MEHTDGLDGGGMMNVDRKILLAYIEMRIKEEWFKHLISEKVKCESCEVC